MRSGPKRILITGASSGLGAALARALAPGGHRLALVARRGDRLGEVAAEARRLGGEALAIVEDLADPDSSARIVAATVAELGGIDVLINNAGMGLPRYYSESPPRALRDQVAVNFAAPILLTREALPSLIESGGSVITIGSAIVVVANPMLGVYGATKAGLAYWNDALRIEMRGRGVSVSLVELGPVTTEFFDAVRRRCRSADAGPPSESSPLRIRSTMRCAIARRGPSRSRSSSPRVGSSDS